MDRQGHHLQTVILRLSGTSLLPRLNIATASGSLTLSSPGCSHSSSTIRISVKSVCAQAINMSRNLTSIICSMPTSCNPQMGCIRRWRHTSYEGFRCRGPLHSLAIKQWAGTVHLWLSRQHDGDNPRRYGSRGPHVAYDCLILRGRQ